VRTWQRHLDLEVQVIRRDLAARKTQDVPGTQIAHEPAAVRLVDVSRSCTPEERVAVIASLGAIDDPVASRRLLELITDRIRSSRSGRSTSWSTRRPIRCKTIWSTGSTTGRGQRPGSAAGRTSAARNTSTALLPARWRDARHARAAARHPAEIGPAAAVLSELRDRVRAVELERAAERACTGGRGLGRRAVLAQSWRASPASVEPRRNLRPRVASRSKWARIEALLRNRAFAIEYASARERWRDCVPAVFPPGTYWLQRFASVPVLET
jgi:hypothetical protein